MITFCLNEATKTGSSSTWVLSNHDVVRHTSRYGLPTDVDLDEWLMSDGALPLADEITGLRRARAATMLMLALPGSSYLYQGEELGLHEVADLPAQALQDPIWQRTLNTKKGRDGCRVPLPWTDEGHSYGFGDEPRLAAPAGGLLADGGGRPVRSTRSRRSSSTARRCGYAASCRPPRRWSGCRPRTPTCCTSCARVAGTAYQLRHRAGEPAGRGGPS